MNNEFKIDFYQNRDDMLFEIKENSYNWNRFITYWSKILDKYSVDNVLNLYSYNQNGTVYYTFDDWNSENIGRRIKRNSKGIPILIDDRKTYVFDIKQTYGRDYNEWGYFHFIDYEILLYYQSKNNILNDNNISVEENFYNTFKEISKNNIQDNYNGLKEEEVEFISKMMTSLFLSKINFNIYKLPSSYIVDNSLTNDELLKCMQISNKETANIYNDFKEKETSIQTVKNYIQTNVLFNFKEDNKLTEEEKQKFIAGIESNTNLNYKFLEDIYTHYIDKYKNSFKRREDKIDSNQKLKYTSFHVLMLKVK